MEDPEDIETRRLVDHPFNEISTMSQPTNRNKFIHRAITFFVFAFVVAFSLYFTFYTAKEPVWFHLHPLIASLGFYAFLIYAVLLKKQQKTRQHAYVTFIAAAVGAFGIWIAYLDKSSRGKSHFVSTHAQFGLATFLLMASFPFLSWVLLNPDNGYLVGNQSIRKLHRWIGQAILIVSLLALGYGLAKYEKNQYALALLITAMLSVVPWVLQ